MKKGFTLIELLVTIVVIGIVAMITYPVVGNIITAMEERAFVESRKGLIRAAKLYMEGNQDLLPYNVGDVTEISIATLVNEKYIKEVKSPIDGSTCGGYILIRQNETTGNDYYPHYRCGAGSNITSRAEDSLVLNYTFDDFQEPTVNLIQNPSGTILTNSVPGNYKPGWDTTLHSDALVAANWSNGYNGGVPSPSIGYHARWVKENGNPMMLFEDKNNIYGLGHRWLGISQNLGVSSSLGLTANAPLSLSWSQKTDVAGKGANPGLYHTLISTGAPSFETNITTVNTTSINQWERAFFTSTVGSNWDLTKNLSVYFYGQSGAYGKLWIDDAQLELKSYSTPFVNGSRDGTVKDYSGNGYSAPLSLSTTPRWIYDNERKSGTYLFDNDTITFGTGNTFFPMNSFTMMAWIKTPGLGSGMTLNGIVSITYGLSMYLDGSGNLNFRMDNGTALPSISFARSLHDNKYHHVAVSFNGTNRKMYIDGELVSTSSFTGWTGSTRWNTNTAVIGHENNNGSFYRFNGNIDEFKMYKRALNDDEIKNLYYMERVN